LSSLTARALSRSKAVGRRGTVNAQAATTVLGEAGLAEEK
jgi:hypothetical protein